MHFIVAVGIILKPDRLLCTLLLQQLTGTQEERKLGEAVVS
jgi:hypothetical protein